jgi:hypothetical protein
VIDDPLQPAGVITARPLDTSRSEFVAIRLRLQHRRVRHTPRALQAMHDIINAHARDLTASPHLVGCVTVMTSKPSLSIGSKGNL